MRGPHPARPVEVSKVPGRVGALGRPDEEATRVVIVRHGDSACSVAGVIGGTRGCSGLSPLGMEQAERLRDRLVATGELWGAGALYSSDLPRAFETAGIVAPGIGCGNLECVRDPGLRELEPGEADGLTWEEYERRYPAPDFDEHPGRPVAPGGESWSDFVERASGALRSLAGRHPGELVVAVCHAGVVEAAMLRFLPVSAERHRLKLPTANTSLTEWQLGSSGWRLVRYNDAAHLVGP